MTAYVDNAAILFRGRERFHLCAETRSELHEFAGRLGVARAWFHASARLPHYDITEEQRDRALALGAIPVSSRALVRLFRRPMH